MKHESGRLEIHENRLWRGGTRRLRRITEVCGGKRGGGDLRDGEEEEMVEQRNSGRSGEGWQDPM